MRQIRVFEKSHGKVGERTDGDDLQHALLFQCITVDGIPGIDTLDRTSGMGQVKTSHAVGAMHCHGFHPFTEDRTCRSAVDGHIPIQKFNQSEGVISGVLQPHVACHTGDRKHVQLGQLFCQQKGDGIIHTRVAVQDHRNGLHAAPFPYQETA